MLYIGFLYDKLLTVSVGVLFSAPTTILIGVLSFIPISHSV